MLPYIFILTSHKLLFTTVLFSCFCDIHVQIWLIGSQDKIILLCLSELEEGAKTFLVNQILATVVLTLGVGGRIVLQISHVLFDGFEIDCSSITQTGDDHITFISIEISDLDSSIALSSITRLQG
ncbi:hypothetical protein ACJX0J_021131 [Zea mays]